MSDTVDPIYSDELPILLEEIRKGFIASGNNRNSNAIINANMGITIMKRREAQLTTLRAENERLRKYESVIIDIANLPRTELKIDWREIATKAIFAARAALSTKEEG